MKLLTGNIPFLLWHSGVGVPYSIDVALTLSELLLFSGSASRF
jgi:hypothetical protein